jgi:hypothetical protein
MKKKQRGISHERANRKKKAEQTSSEAHWETATIEAVHNQTERERQINGLLDLAEFDYVKQDSHRSAKVAASIAWLRENKDRKLPHEYVEQFKRYETGQRLKDEGVPERPEWSDEERNKYIAKKKSEQTLLQLRREETRHKNVAFLDDPSLLPKRPPCARKADDDE